MGVLSESERRRRREEASIVDSLLAGLGAGLTFNWGDEIMGNGESMAAAHDANPIAYAGGEVAGSAPWAFAGSGLAHAIAREGGPKTRLLTALLAGALHGGVAGSGGFRPGNLSAEERMRDAGIGAGIGAAVGGLGMPGSRATRELIDNLPAITGRVAVPGVGADTFERAGLGQGTRRGAPLTISLAGEGSPEERARAAIQAALAQDESGMVRDTGRAVLGRWANDGENLRAFGADNLGPSMDALRSFGAQSPGGSQRLEGMANDLIEASVRRQMRSMRAPPKPEPGGLLSRGRLAKEQMADFVGTFDDPQFHQSWLREVKRLDEGQKATLAARLVRELRSRAKNSTRGEAETFQRYLRDPVVSNKLKALGVNIGNLRGARKAGREVEAEVNRLREMARRKENATYNFRNFEDRDLAGRGTLNDADANALLAAMLQPQRAFAVRPNSEARALSGAYERGVRFDPRSWFDTSDVNDVMGSVMFAQPVAAGLPTLGGALMYGRRDR